MSDTLELHEATRVLARSRVADYWELTKPRIAGMVLAATGIGFYLALPSEASIAVLPLLFHTLIATALVGGGANALNQYIEAPYDRMMVRTARRPLAAGRLTAAEGLWFAILLGIAGVSYLALMVNPLAAAIAAVSFLTYALVYTPLKRTTMMCVFVGAVPGALPPVIGWAAVSGSLTTGTWLLFAVLYFWQLPHFAAIAWLYKEDYARAGYPMLPVIDPNGTRTNMHVVTHSVALLTASLLPAFYGMVGAIYAISAVVLGLAFLGFGISFLMSKTKARARRHLIASLVYLPALFATMLIDKVAA